MDTAGPHAVDSKGAAVRVKPRPGRDAASLQARRARILLRAATVPHPRTIAYVDRPSVEDFRSLAVKGMPFIIRGVVDHWPIFHATMKDLEANFGGLKVRPRVGDYVSTAFTGQRTHEEMSLRDYLRMMERAEPGLPPYVGNHPLPLPSLCNWPDYFQAWEEPRVWLGPAGTVTPLHCDYDDNLFSQVWGSKRVILYSAACADRLYLTKFNEILFGSAFDPENADFDRYPLAASAVRVDCVVAAGEMLYLPAGWFHHVRALEFSLSINRWTSELPMALREG